MVHIIYRKYQKGDDSQLSDLFNRAFQMNGGGFMRTPKGTNWRYAQSPDFEPEMIQIAEDVDEDKIVGAVYANLIEKVRLNNKDYLMGDINDVSCLPEYTKSGIAKRLMKMAIDYMKSKNCDLSILNADFKGFPRKRIYWKLGYKDFDRSVMFFAFSKSRNLIKHIPAFIVLTPILICYSYIPRLLIKFLIRLKKSFQDFKYKILHNRGHYKYMEAANKILSKYYNGYLLYSKRKVDWARINVPSKRYNPTYILIYKKKEVVGGACITAQNIYASKYGIKARLGIIHEIFLQKDLFQSKKQLNLGYRYLINKILKAARQRNIGAVIYNCSNRDRDLNSILKRSLFLSFKAGTVMLKKFSPHIGNLKNEFPLYIPTYVSLGFP